VTQDTEIFVNRESEMEKVTEAFRDGKHILVYGEPGCGKTAFANEFIRRLCLSNLGHRVVVCNRCLSFKDTCLELIECLYRMGSLDKLPHMLAGLSHDLPWQKMQPHFAALGVIDLKNLALRNIYHKNLVIVFDHFGKIERKFFHFLDGVRDHARLFLVARGTQKKEMGRLWMLLWGFERIELKLLSHQDMSRLAAYWLRGVEKGLSENDKWFQEVLRVSQGNPKILYDLCDQIHNQHLAAVNVQIAEIDRKIADFLKEKGT